MSGSQIAGDERSAWFFRPIILFATAYIINSIIHESAHALTAYALDVPFRLFHFAVDVSRDRGTAMDHAVIAIAGPFCSLIIGFISWFGYRRAKGSRAKLFLLYLATFGIGTFLGNLMSSAFVGDFSRVGVALHAPMPGRYAASLIGLLSVCGVHFLAGWELRGLSLIGSSRLRATMVMVVLPAVAGMAIVTLSALPMPTVLVFSRLAETTFWIFSAAGVLMSRKTPSGSGSTLHVVWMDIAALAAVVIVVRLVALGITF